VGIAPTTHIYVVDRVTSTAKGEPGRNQKEEGRMVDQ
jgi:hypothetical protein